MSEIFEQIRKSHIHYNSVVLQPGISTSITLRYTRATMDNMDNMASINLGTTELSPAAAVALEILIWTGAILWIILSTVLIGSLAFVSSKRIHSRCNFTPVKRYSWEETPYTDAYVAYTVFITCVYGLLTLTGSGTCATHEECDLKLFWLEIIMVTLGVQGLRPIHDFKAIADD